MLQSILAGKRPALPRVGFYFVGVQDVVDLHLRVLAVDAIGEQRVIAASDFLW